MFLEPEVGEISAKNIRDKYVLPRFYRDLGIIDAILENTRLCMFL